VATLLERDDLETLRPQLMSVTAPRQRAWCPTELSAAVDLALAAWAERPPQGITQGDWERVLDARRQEATRTLEDLRHLGPVLELAQVLLMIDAVLTWTQHAHQFWGSRRASWCQPVHEQPDRARSPGHHATVLPHARVRLVRLRCPLLFGA